MIVTAALPWYDEAPEDLDRYVRALPVVADRLVALDGGYARYPGAKPRSAKAEEAAIRDAAADIGLPVEVVIPDRIWPGQLAKRTALYNAAAAGSDWIFTLDADHIPTGGDRATIRAELETVELEDGVEVDFYTPPNPARPIEKAAATDWHASLSGQTTSIRLFLRALPEIQVEHYHWWVSALKCGVRVWIYGGDDRYPASSWRRLSAPLVVEHLCLFRRERNILAGREYARDRVLIVAATGQEDAL